MNTFYFIWDLIRRSDKIIILRFIWNCIFDLRIILSMWRNLNFINVVWWRYLVLINILTSSSSKFRILNDILNWITFNFGSIRFELTSISWKLIIFLKIISTNDTYYRGYRFLRFLSLSLSPNFLIYYFNFFFRHHSKVFLIFHLLFVLRG